MSLSTFLYVAAAILFFLAMVGVPDAARFKITAGGLFCWLMAAKIGDGTFPFGN